MKICTKCNIEQPLSNYHKSKITKDRLKPACKTCRSNYMKKRRLSRLEQSRKESRDWAKNNPDKVKDSMYRINYGISYSDFKKLAHKQEGKCALCTLKPKTTLCIDHNHSTGQIRGLLCRSCNGALGVFGDSVEGLHKAILYLEGSG